MNNICLIIIILIIIYFCYCNINPNNLSNSSNNSSNKENYSPIIVRPLELTKSENDCKFPNTNNKKDTIADKNVYRYQYANRILKPPDKYLNMVSKLLNDLSTKNINIPKINNKNLVEKDYLGDTDILTNHMNNKINELIKTKDYLQQNGSWKYEYFYTKEPNVYYYSVMENGKHKYNLFKIIYTMANPLRSSYTSCLAFITEIDNKLEIQYTTFINDIVDDDNEKGNDKLDVIPKQALNFKFLNQLADLDFDQYATSTDYSGLNYIDEYKEGTKIEVKADIPQEFKQNTFKPQFLPPEFGNGVCKYPPNYKQNNENKYYNSPPIN